MDDVFSCARMAVTLVLTMLIIAVIMTGMHAVYRYICGTEDTLVQVDSNNSGDVQATSDGTTVNVDNNIVVNTPNITVETPVYVEKEVPVYIEKEVPVYIEKEVPVYIEKESDKYPWAKEVTAGVITSIVCGVLGLVVANIKKRRNRERAEAEMKKAVTVNVVQ